MKIIAKTLDENINLTALLDLLYQYFDEYEYLSEKHKIRLSNHSDKHAIYINLPLSVSLSNVTVHQKQELNYVIVIIHAGEASLALLEDEEIIEHKNLKAYMVRKKQGKSQLKHLKTKGKSKAGSRVRLANTEHFFNQIHELLNEWLAYYSVENIAVSCPKTLVPHLYSKELNLDKADSRIIKIPIHIEEANHTNLLKTCNYLFKCHISYPEWFSEDLHLMLDQCNNFLDDEDY